MRRDRWTFEYGNAKLLAAAQAKAAHHHARRGNWEEQKLVALTSIREVGLAVTEGFTLDMGTSASIPGRGPDVLINADLKRKVGECHGKVQEHRTKAAQYEQWIQVLKAHPEQAYALEWDDWLYFFGK